MKARQVIDELRRYGFTLQERAGKLVVSPRAALTPLMLAEVIANRDEIVRLLPMAGTPLWEADPDTAVFRPWPTGAPSPFQLLPEWAAEKPPKFGERPAVCFMCGGGRFIRKSEHEYTCIQCHPPAYRFDPQDVYDSSRPASQETTPRSKEDADDTHKAQAA